MDNFCSCLTTNLNNILLSGLVSCSEGFAFIININQSSTLNTKQIININQSSTLNTKQIINFNQSSTLNTKQIININQINTLNTKQIININQSSTLNTKQIININQSSTLNTEKINKYFVHFSASTYMVPYLHQFSAKWDNFHFVWNKSSIIPN